MITPSESHVIAHTALTRATRKPEKERAAKHMETKKSIIFPITG